MKMIKALAVFAGLCILLTYTSCTSGGSGFTTKQDSLNFAKAYFNKYPDENSVIAKYNSDDSVVAKGFGPISWTTVKAYEQAYDKNPLIFSLDGKPLKGYIIDTAGYSMLKANKAIKGIYMRLGKKADGAITIMILGLDASGEILKDSAEKMPGENPPGTYDNTDPCPKNCPANDD